MHEMTDDASQTPQAVRGCSSSDQQSSTFDASGTRRSASYWNQYRMLALRAADQTSTMPRLVQVSSPNQAATVAWPRGASSSVEAVRGAYREISAELKSLDISSRAARANHGDTTLLHWNMGRCFDSGVSAYGATSSASPPSLPELRVLVVGCSMTQGFMNCGSTIEGKQCNVPCDAMAWYRRLESWLQHGLPGCRVRMFRTTSRGGRTVTTAQRYETRVKRAARSPHIIITDLTVCDLRGVTSSLDEVRIKAGWETLIRRVLTEDTSPALVQMESWAAFSPMGPCRTNSSAHALHLPLSQHYGVPVASFMLGVCANRPETAPLRHWRGGCSPNASSCGGLLGEGGLDTHGFECEPHPGPHTHRVYALVLAELLLGEARRLVLGSQGMHSAKMLRDAVGGRGAPAHWHSMTRNAPLRSSSGGKPIGRRERFGSPPTRPLPLNVSSAPTIMPETALAEVLQALSHSRPHGATPMQPLYCAACAFTKCARFAISVSSPAAMRTTGSAIHW